MRRFLIFIAVVVVVFIILNLILSRLATDAVNEGLQRFIDEQEDEAVVLRFEDTSVNTLGSSFRIRGLEIEQPETGELTQIDELAVSISYRDFAGLIASRAGGEAPEVRRGKLTMNNVTHKSGDGPGYTFDQLTLDIDGNLADLMRSFDSGFRKPPRHNQKAQVEVLNFQPFYELDFMMFDSDISIPLPVINRFFVDGSYDTATDLLTIDRSEMNFDRTSYHMDLSLSDLSYFYGSADTNEASTIPYIRASLLAESTERERFNLIPGGLGLHYEKFELNYEGPFRRGSSVREILFSDQTQISIDAREVTLYSPEQFRQNYGQALRFMGISDEQITVPGITAKYTVSSERADIQEFSINNPFAGVSVTGALLMREGEPWEWENAAIRISPSTRESKNFIETMKSFFDLNIPEEDGTYIIRIGGTLQEPTLDGISS